jgi:thiamine-monophosphate kinase
MKLKRIGEFGLIEEIKKWVSFKDRNVILGIGDDAAAIEIGESILLLTTDILAEDVHFKLKWTSPFNIGYKSLAINISDIAAMGGIPLYCVVCLGIDKSFELNFVKEIYKGLKKIANEFKIKIIGGDSINSKKIFINISLIGAVEKENLITRNKASAGDLILVTGKLGDSSSGLYLLNKKKISKIISKEGEILIKKHHLPFPRLKEARILANSKIVNSMIDLSDGLSGDLKKICKASKVGAKIYRERIPISSECKKISKFYKKDPLEFALYGGEDYELLFTIPHKNMNILQELATENNLEISIIGEITENEDIKIIDSKGKEKLILDKSYNHFS